MLDHGKAYPKRLRLFRSDLLERLTVMSPQAFVLTWTVLLGLVLWACWGVASIGASIGLALLGLSVWSVFEYGMHRFIFHMKLQSEVGQWVIFVMHGNHHADPNDPHRNMMPPIISVVWAGAIWVVLLLLLGRIASVFFLGFAIGYVTYDGVHYACHRLPMRGPLLRALRQHHLRHHFARQEGNYAITAIFWDRVFGSRISIKARARL